MAYRGRTSKGRGGSGSGSGSDTSASVVEYSSPISQQTKSITYSADTPNLLLDLSAASSATVSKTAPIKAVRVRNDGYVTALASFAYNSYEA